ncbi:unnamed protein product, partial [marine sediment metagenome]
MPLEKCLPLPEEICENIQNSLETEISTAKIDGEEE